MQEEQAVKQRIKSDLAARLGRERLSPRQEQRVDGIFSCLGRLKAKRLRYS